MRKILASALVLAAALAAAPSADARNGCGIGWHRAPNGQCYVNRGGPAVVVGVPGIGIYVGGRGYWDGHRYWGHRYRWGGGWRYR